MKKKLLVPFVTMLILGTSCQQNVNVEKEKEAIMAVLQEEADAIKAMDKERVFAVHMKDSYETRLELGIYGYNVLQGWDEVGVLLGDVAENGLGVENPVNSKENVILKVTGNSAWVTCDNIWKWTVGGQSGGFNNIQIVFLEKIKGDWKISFAAYYTKGTPPTEVEAPIQ